MENVCVFGAGYIGLATSVFLCEHGGTVVCVDTDQDKVKELSSGEVSILEPGMDVLVKKYLLSGQLFFTVEADKCIKDSEFIFICVPTPTDCDGKFDYTYLSQVQEELIHCGYSNKTIIMRSTVPVGTCSTLQKELNETLEEITVISNPEFLREGSAIQDMTNPYRTVFGCDADYDYTNLYKIYGLECENNEQSEFYNVLLMDTKSSEMSKYASNTMLAMRISSINEIANICGWLGADIKNVTDVMKLDPRIGPEFLNPGVGYGGGCFPKDIKSLMEQSNSIGMSSEMLKVTEYVNEQQVSIIFNKIVKSVEYQPRGKTVGVWGLTFKPFVNDIRESRSIVLIKKLLDVGFNVVAYDPSGIEDIGVVSNSLSVVYNKYDVLHDSYILIIMTEWLEFFIENIDQDTILSSMKNPAIVDGRNCIDITLLNNKIKYTGMGVRDDRNV